MVAVTVIGEPGPCANGTSDVQTFATHVYFVVSAVIDTNVRPVGRTSVTDQPVNASAGPSFDGMRV
ncbi:MAG: hypothetical protein BWY91_00800 [bacterium ADurb.BinA028]|nr:MAG: hypothetical protein BWY91_00800 [bacterium ADurb.BinA028]